MSNLTPYRKGQSGNPLGRPKGCRNKKSILKEFLELEIEKDGIKQTTEEHLWASLINKGLNGDIRAIKEIFDRYYGIAPIEQENVVSVSIKPIEVLDQLHFYNFHASI